MHAGLLGCLVVSGASGHRWQILWVPGVSRWLLHLLFQEVPKMLDLIDTLSSLSHRFCGVSGCMLGLTAIREGCCHGGCSWSALLCKKMIHVVQCFSCCVWSLITVPVITQWRSALSRSFKAREIEQLIWDETEGSIFNITVLKLIINTATQKWHLAFYLEEFKSENWFLHMFLSSGLPCGAFNVLYHVYNVLFTWCRHKILL